MPTLKSDKERWDDEGGSQLQKLAQSLAEDALDDSERRILSFLGASVVSLWDDLPTDARQKILNLGAAQAAFDKSVLKQGIVRVARDCAGPLEAAKWSA
ncbi:hypothetical protein D9M72_59650 [compost metagenome]|jgi:uncharacterized protein YbcI